MERAGWLKLGAQTRFKRGNAIRWIKTKKNPEIHHHLRQFSRIRMNTKNTQSQLKFINSYPLERSNRVEHEYPSEIVQNFMYGANRAKENLASKP